MDVCVLKVGDQPWADKMIASVRQVMPDARIVQMTDETTAALPADEIVRLPFDGLLMTFRLQHLALFPHKEAVILDSDVIVKRSVAHLFHYPFDIALTKRDKLIVDGQPAAQIMPFNTGVMFSRCQDFWKDAYQFCKELPTDYQSWWGDQLAVARVVNSGKYKIKALTCESYNWTPRTQESTSEAYVWHYKGNRKEWMSAT